MRQKVLLLRNLKFQILQAYIYASLDDGKMDMSSLKLGAYYYGGIHIYDMGKERWPKFERFVKMLDEASLFTAAETTK